MKLSSLKRAAHVRAARFLFAPALALAASAAISNAAHAQNGAGQYGCACVTNETGADIKFRWKFGDKPFTQATVNRGNRYWVCHDYGSGPRSSPPLLFQLDVDMSKGSAWTTYELKRFQSAAKDCRAIPSGAQYGVRYRPNTNKQYIEVYKR